MAKPHIVIVGAGALGCLFGAGFCGAGYGVTLVTRTPESAALLQQNGIRIDSDNKTRTVTGFVATADYASVRDASVVVILVKSSATAAVAKALAPHLTPNTLVLTLQNGLGNVEALTAHIPVSRVAVGITGNGAALLGTGYIRFGGITETVLGEQGGGPSMRLDAVRDIFVKAGFPTRVSETITSAVWTKLMVNVGLNPVSALTGLRNGDIIKETEAFALAEAAVREAATVAAALGIRLDVDDPVAHTHRAASLTAVNETSMLQDLRAGRLTEIEAMNGQIELHAKALGIPVPVNTTLASLIRLQQKRRSEAVDKGPSGAAPPPQTPPLGGSSPWTPQ